ncbi:hypothetical protein [Paenalcaligenes suwonensis]|uniref:hypothetical protein n=1 Tax=Paenalcaligenes suwonensis TaxID=1202713 RepID=UPI001408140E|nr:hypothetical protein [Paenalcaligenes suwonensis]NHC63076.1 hypothetical protein [Paenalcaligenes suwonensis]
MMRSFHIFRYQILPNNRNFQGSIYDGKTVNDVIAEKNNIFWEAISNSDPFYKRNSETVIRILAEEDDIIVFMVGVEKKLKKNTKDFKVEKIDTWPDSIFVIWNNPERQLIAVQNNPAAFSTPSVLLKRFEKNINRQLSIYQLGIYSNPIFDKNDFWELIASNNNSIEAVEFTFLTPNMASISQTLTDDLKEFAKKNNSVENKIELRANKGHSLSLSPNEPQTSGLIDYISNGGGATKVKLHNIRKKVTVGNTTKEVEVTGLELEGLNANETIAIFKSIFDD